MRLRSLLFVPGDRPDRMEKALGSGADALILDLEDSVAPAQKPEARRAVADFLSRERRTSLWVRINPIEEQEADRDIAAIIAGRPDGIVLPKSLGGASVSDLAKRLTERGNVGAMILPLATEMPAALFTLDSYAGVKRLAGITWGAEDLSAAIGAATAREEDGSYTEPFRVARSLCLFGASAAGVPAIETVYPDFRDLDGLAAYAARGRRDGFSGMLAIHPDQVPVINTAFTPSGSEVAHARAVVDAFRANPDAGVLSLDGKMIDRPHLMLAQRILAASADG
jgi:citrate lyase subunit beta/citryl-CoA lyase